jgi:small nuclear ribonucleoprotein F
MLKNLIGKTVKVKLKWGMVYHGKLVAFDSYMNIRLDQTEEWIENVHIGNLGQILIRCNNISYLSEF